MKRYSFLYGYKYKKLSELIEYLEEKYNLEYSETIDFNSPISINLPIGFSMPLKEIMFKSNKEFDNIKKCKDCNFPTAPDDWDLLGGTRDMLICKNCRKDIN